MLGMHGTRAANYAMDEADLIVRGRRALRRPHHRQAVASSRRARSSSTSTSTRPRSPRTSRPTSRSSATPSTCSRSSSSSTARSSADPARLEEWWTRIDGWREQHPLRYDDSDRHRDQARSAWSRRSTRRPAATRSSPPTSASTRCGPRSTSTSTSRAAGSTPAASARWASACPRRWAPRSAARTRPVVCIAGDGSVQMNMQELATCAQEGIADQGVHHEQRLPGHGPPVAGAVLGQALLARRHGRVPGLRQARRGLRRDRHAPRRQDHARRRT